MKSSWGWAKSGARYRCRHVDKRWCSGLGYKCLRKALIVITIDIRHDSRQGVVGQMHTCTGTPSWGPSHHESGYPRDSLSHETKGHSLPIHSGNSVPSSVWRVLRGSTLSLPFLPPANGLVSRKLSPHLLHLTRSLRRTYVFKELESFLRIGKAVFPGRFPIGQGLRPEQGLPESSHSSLDSVSSSSGQD